MGGLFAFDIFGFSNAPRHDFISDMDEKLPGMFIRVPRAWPPYRRAAVLLTTMARPPQVPNDLAWKRRIISVCRCFWSAFFAHAPGSESLAGTYIPEELMVPLTQAERELEEVLDSLNRGLAAPDVLGVFFLRAQARLLRKPVPRARQKPELKKEIETVLRRESAYRMSLSPKLRKAMRRRMPHSSSARGSTNFAQRNLRPFRPVWHILAAFSYELDKRARLAIGAAKRRASDRRRLVASPRLWLWDITGSPELLDAVFETARRLEPLVPLLEIAHNADDKLIRLRLH